MRSTCEHCGAESADFELGQHAEVGFCRAWNINNGCVQVWLCLGCSAKVAAAWRTIVEVCGIDTVSLSGLLKQFDRAEAGAVERARIGGGSP